MPYRKPLSTDQRYYECLMASDEEVLAQFEDVIKKMDLPPDKIRALRDVDISKKWELVRNQQQMDKGAPVPAPSEYLEKLVTLIGEKRSVKKKKKVGGELSTTLLRHIETSLRTNSIDWVRTFLGPENDGLRILIEYLMQLQESLVCTTLSDFSATTASTETLTPTVTVGQSSFFTNGGCHKEAAVSHSNFSASASSTEVYPTPQSAANSNHNSSLESAHNNGLSKSILFKKSNSTTSNGSMKSKSSKYLIEDDVHVCVSCLRAIMNNRYGLNMVLKNKQAIYCIVRAILHPSLRTKTLAIDLLSAICVLTDGHGLVLNAFDRFREDHHERYRFQILFHYFRAPSQLNVDFVSSCIKFINVLVNSPDDINMRVSLQYEFSSLGLDSYLRELENEFDGCETLMNHLASYSENYIDVEGLITASHRCKELQTQLEQIDHDYSRQREEFQVLQAQNYIQITKMNDGLKKLQQEKADLEWERDNRDVTISTLSRDFKMKEQKYTKDINELEERIKILEEAKREMQHGLKVAQQQSQKVSVASSASPPRSSAFSTASNVSSSSISSDTTTSTSFEKKQATPIYNGVSATPSKKSTVAPPPPPADLINNKPSTASAPSPAPPLPPFFIGSGSSKAPACGGGPPPPPPPPPSSIFKKPLPPVSLGKANAAQQQQVPNKRIAITKNKLPLLNWSALNPNQVKGTVFNELNDEKLVDVLDLSFLEDFFKIGEKGENVPLEDNSSISSGAGGQNSPRSSATSNAEKTSLLDTKRLQNIAIIRRKLGKSVMDIMSAVHCFDLSALSQDQVEILMKIVPTTEEVKKYKEYGAQNSGSYEGLTIEDQFMAEIMEIERLQIKLQIMSFMAGFAETYKLVLPQLQKIIAASKSLRDAKKFPKVMEVILAIGNAMNGTRRVPVYGFKLSSLDSLNILRSPKDRSITLMTALANIIANTFPTLLDFTSELTFVEAAANVNMETLSADVNDVERKLQQALTEQQRREKETPAALNDFIEIAKPQIEILRENFKLAQESFDSCAEYYGEAVGRISPDTFFSKVTTFSKNYTQASNENEVRKKRLVEEQKRKTAQQAQRRKAGNVQQERLLDELSAKFIQSQEGSGCDGGKRQKLGRQKLDSTQMNDGDFERIISGLKDGYVVQSLGIVNGGIRRIRKPSPTRRHELLNSAREIQTTSNLA